jgi:hypothetical protein
MSSLICILAPLKLQNQSTLQELKCESPISSPVNVDLTVLLAMAATRKEEELVGEAWLPAVATVEDGATGWRRGGRGHRKEVELDIGGGGTRCRQPG